MDCLTRGFGLRLLAALALGAAGGEAQRWAGGSCPDLGAQKNFNFLAFYGRWFEQLRYHNEYQIGTQCESRDYWPNGDGYINIRQNRFDFARNEHNWHGTLVTSGSLSEGKFDEQFPVLWNAKMRYWVLETDYFKYSIDWSCREIIPFLLNRQYLWVYTRLRSPSEEYISELRRRVGEMYLDTGPLERTVQICANFHPPS